MERLTVRKITAFACAVLAALCLAACAAPSETTGPATEPGTRSVINITTAPETQPSETASAGTTEAPTGDPASAEGGSSEVTARPFDNQDLILVVDGVELSLGMDFVPSADRILGGKYDLLEGQACVVGGRDRNYFYLGDAVGIYTVGGAKGEQNIYDIFISLEGFATRKGAVIGQTSRDEVLGIYGEPAESSSASARYRADGRYELTFSFEGEILSSVSLHDDGVR